MKNLNVKNYTAITPSRSITLKAKIVNYEQIETEVFKLTNEIGHVSYQESVYFNVPYGQMQLRISRSSAKDNAELLSYKQTNNIGLNFSESRITQVSNPKNLRHTLALSLTEICSIKKKRRTYVKENVEIHLDEVEDLGLFVDINLNCNGTSKYSSIKLLEQAEAIQKALNINESQLIQYSYFELFCQKRKISENNNLNIIQNNKKIIDNVAPTKIKTVVSNQNIDDGESGISEGDSCFS